jgi:8-oxo-dGTP diphosphatase
VPLRSKPFDFDAAQLAIYEEKKQIETFRFISKEDFGSETVHLPIDKLVAGMVRMIC